MKNFKTRSEFIAEAAKKAEKKVYKFGCAYLDFDFPDMENIHKQIDYEDVYDPPHDNSYSYEKSPHITLLYGFKMDKTEASDVMKALEPTIEAIKKLEPNEKEMKDVFFIHNVSLFENEEFDVLKFDVKYPNGILSKANKKLTEEFEWENKYPGYHPHVTICYLKSGKGKDYLKKFEGKEYVLKPTKVVYSANGKKTSKAV